MHIFDLLKTKPEQEANLLRLGVNKLGDSDKKVASKISYFLLQLEQAHPAMKGIVVDAISELLFRPGSDYHSRYYSIITINQTILTNKETEVANSLMKTYLSLFEKLLAEWKNEKEGPKEEPKKVKKPRWKSKGNKGKNGGERKVAKTNEVVKEEENTKLTSAILTGMNRAFPFSELPKEVLLSHIDTLYRVTHSANFNTSVQALILLFQISKGDVGLSDRFYKTLYESLLDPRLTNSSKLRLYLNLLFKAIKQDVEISRVKAFAKRMVQVATHWLNIGVIAGVIYLLYELSRSSPRIRELVIATPTDTLNEGEEIQEYDGKKRDPAFANANNTKLWELQPLLKHFHPTVSLYARHLAGLEKVDPKNKVTQPDLSLHSLVHFLDKFVYKNPKQNQSEAHGSSIMQPLSGSLSTGLIIGADGNKKSAPVNIRNWGNVNIEDVDVGERFFYNYFKKKTQKTKKEKSSEGDEEIDEEDQVWKALVNSKPDIEDEGSDLSMEDFSDFEDDEDENEEEGVDGIDEEDLVDSENDGKPVDDDEDDDDDDLGLDDEEGILGSDEEIEISAAESADEEELEALFEKELEKAGTKRSMSESDSEDEEEEEEKAVKPKKKKSKKQKLKDLPVFASADDYAQYLGSSDEDYS